MSINDILTENTYHYYATDIDYMTESFDYYSLHEAEIESNEHVSYKGKTYNADQYSVIKSDNHIEDKQILTIRPEDYPSYKSYIDELNKRYFKLIDKYTRERDTDNLGILKREYNDLTKRAREYFSVYAPRRKTRRYKKDKIPNKRDPFKHFRESTKRSKDEIPDYSSFRTDGTRKNDRELPNFDNYRISPDKDNTQIPDYHIRETEKPEPEKVPEFNIRKDRTITEKGYIPDFSGFRNGVDDEDDVLPLYLEYDYNTDRYTTNDKHLRQKDIYKTVNKEDDDE